MLRDIIYQLFSSPQDMEVAGETNDVSRLVSAARQARADVVVIMVSPDNHVDWQALLFSRP
jgi:DNA-binding NarL/FixJ family response regulator